MLENKQINHEQNSVIIDGIDVSGCECYSEHREGYCGWHTPCEGDTCPYKLKWALQQLKTKERENEELKKNYFTVIQQRNVTEQQLDQLRAENDKLKEEVQYLKSEIERISE